MQKWVETATNELLALRQQPGWGYRAGQPAAVEPTVLACLALLASIPRDRRIFPAMGTAADWLVKIQQVDGSVGITEAISQPAWPSAHAALLWTVSGMYFEPENRAIKWLLGHKGIVFAKKSNDPIGHDTTIAGWPWVAETHSWLEPTAMAILALRRAKKNEGNERFAEGLKLIRDRAVAAGGWNYGNSRVFDRDLRAQPGPTGMALLALIGNAQRSEPVVARAISYLLAELPKLRSPQSLGWGVMALTAWQSRPKEADDWLTESHARLKTRPDRAMPLALLVLAAAKGTQRVLGLADE